METRLAKDKAEGIWSRCSFFDGWEYPRDGLNGGLLLAWMPN